MNIYKQVAREKGSLEQQIHIAISEAANRSRQDRVNYRINHFFIEPGITGRHANRPQFQRMKASIKKGTYKFVLIKELSRISRDAGVWKDFFRTCQKNECQILIRNFPFNPNDPSQILQLDIIAAFAEYESNQTSRRVKESVHSAMISSGKFNSTHKRLGLDPQVINGERKVGFYSVNAEEVKTVEWIMRQFVKYASYSHTIEECNKNGIKNWNGENFKKHSIANLLTDTRYIGKWEVNIENKDKNQERLMPYDRYAEIELPHGCIVDIELWQKVQKTVKKISNSKDKNTRINRVYPLTGLLKFKDGSNFHGASAWKRDYKHCYYHNKDNDVRLQAEMVEKEAIKVVSEIIKGSPKTQDALAAYKSQCSSSVTVFEKLRQSLDRKGDTIDGEIKKINKRIDFFIDSGDDSDAEKFKKECLRELAQLKNQKNELNSKIQKLAEKQEAAEKAEFDWKGVGERAQRILEQIDPVALKNAYRSLFDCIVVGDLQKDGKTELKFVLKGESFEFEPSVKRRKKVREGEEMAQVEGLEPPTQ